MHGRDERSVPESEGPHSDTVVGHKEACAANEHGWEWREVRSCPEDGGRRSGMQ